ncbi:hypothetical protein BI364_09825 [Acidihalobacter yilgarnensis]|uniref:Ancillary SecYEG translocon subunit n=1 Tax=Acidihalobacter yilgarnensis TaxID=2819280 RepID=A0A1D8IPB2_9GAMM|nr:tetratricopeptide repeat protein [Acidihalobacter yilgarnensis]AOU98214.1 hypothetical protein BI364_09825 [Acidihalobacter yilgarnensis]
MTAYHVEDEELESAKRWWRRYGRWLVLALVVGLIGFFAWKGWAYYRGREDLKASTLYSQLQTASKRGDAKQWEGQAEVLIRQYDETPYAALASFMLAKQAVLDGHLNAAAKHLRWVVDHGSQKALREIAALRLARVLIAQKKSDEALKLLSSGFSEAYLPLTQALTGDAWLAKGDRVKARDAYEEALAGAQAMGLPTRTLEMKLDALPAPAAQGGK